MHAPAIGRHAVSDVSRRRGADTLAPFLSP
ncbi:hypothetical protein D8I24_6059 [Cupriavidus necator H850]|jgi:hypothetical protein|nr:hypothetical protein D8I24_6059 [Cupriavidus necator H850]